MAFYGVLLCSIALSAIVASVLTKFKRVSRNREITERRQREQHSPYEDRGERETKERLKRDRKPGSGHKID